jgi:hypothetical protein
MVVSLWVPGTEKPELGVAVETGTTVAEAAGLAALPEWHPARTSAKKPATPAATGIRYIIHKYPNRPGYSSNRPPMYLARNFSAAA